MLLPLAKIKNFELYNLFMKKDKGSKTDKLDVKII
jgi:hypothetical protein